MFLFIGHITYVSTANNCSMRISRESLARWSRWFHPWLRLGAIPRVKSALQDTQWQTKVHRCLLGERFQWRSCSRSSVRSHHILGVHLLLSNGNIINCTHSVLLIFFYELSEMSSTQKARVPSIAVTSITIHLWVLWVRSRATNNYSAPRT